MKMNNMRYSFISLAAISCMTILSCTMESESIFHEEGEIRFSAYVDAIHTRTSESKWTGGEKVGIKIGNEIKTYKAASDGSMTTEDPVPFEWTGGDLEVIAWTPLSNNEISLKDQTSSRKFFDCDLLSAESTISSRYAKLVFKHKMTRMQWTLVCEGYSDEQVRNAKVSFLGYGEVSFTDGKVSPSGDSDQHISGYETGLQGSRSGEAMMVPCEMWDKPLIEVQIGGNTFVYVPRKENINDNERQTGVLLQGAWQKYTVSVSRKAMTVVMDSNEVRWNDNDENDIQDAKFKVSVSPEVQGKNQYSVKGITNSYIDNAVDGFSISYMEDYPSGGLSAIGECNISRTAEAGIVTFSFTNVSSDINISYTKEYMEVGYYLYSDGSYGEEYKDGSTVGLIYRTGAHDTDNIELYGGLLSSIHGYAVSLNDEKNTEGTELFKWKDGDNPFYSSEYPEAGIGGGNTSRYIGYANTVYLLSKAVNGTTAPAAETARTRNASGPIAGTSGWYLPSHTQLNDLASLSGKTYDHYTALSGMYWDSSFDSEANAYVRVFSDTGALASQDFYNPVGTEHKVRLIITF